MAEFTHSDLKIARETLKMPRWKLASAVNVSESTLERWETGETQPHPDEVDRLAGTLPCERFQHGKERGEPRSARKQKQGPGRVTQVETAKRAGHVQPVA